jgi:hypothetical protein
MNGWMDGWMDGWLDGWMDGWMDGWLDEISHHCRLAGFEVGETSISLNGPLHFQGVSSFLLCGCLIPADAIARMLGDFQKDSDK